MFKIAFVIPVHNRKPYTQECLTILRNAENTLFFTKNKISIIVVDDGSTDGTAEMIQQNYANVVVLQGDGNLWYSGSLNLGIRHALSTLSCDFINIWENDVIPANEYFNNLQYVLEKWDGLSLISSKLVYKIKPDIVFSMGGVFNPKTGYKKLIGRNKPDGPEFQKPVEADWFSGQQLLIHKSILDKVGLFDEKNFPQYHADIDYSLRAKKAGFKNMVYPELTLLNDSETTGIDHIMNKTFKQYFESLVSIRSNRNIIKDLMFYKKHTTSILAYLSLIKSFSIYTGSFIKWKILGLLGIRKKESKLI